MIGEGKEANRKEEERGVGGMSPGGDELRDWEAEMERNEGD